MRSLVPLAMVMTPPPAQEPDIAAKGLPAASPVPGIAARANAAVAAVAIKVDLTLRLSSLVMENIWRPRLGSAFVVR